MSSVDAGTAVLKIKPDYDGATQSVASEGKGVFGGLGKSMAAAFAGGFVIDKGISIFKDSISEAREAAKVGAETAQILKVTGASAWTSRDKIEALATSISNMTGVDDEAIQHTENLLLTFGNIKDLGGNKDIFSRATGLAQDMAATMGGDAAGAANLLGKALSDPIRGMTGLRRANVTFLPEQEKTIKAMAAAGDTAGAQAALLDAVAGQLGGVAAAQADPIKKLGVQWKNIEEQLGTALLPTVNKVVTVLADNLPGALATAGRWFNVVTDGVKSFLYTFQTGFTEDEGTPLEGIALAARDVAGVFTDDLMPIIRTVGGFLGDNLEPIVIGVGVALAGMAGSAALGAVIGGLTALVGVLASPIVLLGALAAGIVFAYQKSETFRSIVSGAFDLAGKAVSGATELVKGIGGAVSDAAKSVEKSGLKDKLVEAGDRARDSFKGATSAVDDLGSHAVDAGAKIKGSDLMGAISGVDLPDPGSPSSFWSRTGRAVFGVMDDLRQLAGNAGTYGAAFQGGISGPFDAVGSKAFEVFSGVKTNLADAGSNLLGFAGSYGQPFVQDWRRVWDDVGAINRGTVDAFKIAWNDLFSDKTLIDLVRDEASNAMGVLRSGFDIGMAQVQAIWSVNWSGILGTAQAFGGRMVSQVAGDIGGVISWFSGMPGRITGVLGDLKGLLPRKGQEIVSGLQAGAMFAFGEVRNWFGGLGGQITGAAGNAINALYNVGRMIMAGLKRGLADSLQGVKDFVASFGGGIAGTLARSVEARSPSRLFMRIGGWMGQGLQLGIEGTTDDVHNAVRGLVTVPGQLSVPSASTPTRAWTSADAVAAAQAAVPTSPAGQTPWPAPVVNQTIMVHDVREGAMQAADEWWWAQKTAGV